MGKRPTTANSGKAPFTACILPIAATPPIHLSLVAVYRHLWQEAVDGSRFDSDSDCLSLAQVFSFSGFGGMMVGVLIPLCGAGSMVYVFNDCALDDRLYVLRRAGEPLSLEPKVFEVLVYLIHHHDRFVSRDELLEKLWPGVVVSEAALTQCIAKARKAVNDDGGKQQVIKTQHGRGYRFVAEVTEQREEPPVSQQLEETPRQTISPGDQPLGAALCSRPREGSLIEFPLFFGRRLMVSLSRSDNVDRPTQPRRQAYWQRRSLALVGILLVFGMMATRWHFSFHPLSPAGETYTATKAMVPEVLSAEGGHRRLWFLSPNSPGASAYCLRGWDYYHQYTPEANAQARHMFERAVASDPRYAAAYVGLGWTYVLEWSSFWTHDPQGLEQAFVLAQTAIALNSALPHAHALLASVYLLRKQYEYAVTEGERAVTLDPTCADCYATLADILAFAGRARKAIELVEIARSLDPFSAAYYAATAGRAYYLIGQPELAIPALKRALARNPNLPLARLNLALAYSELGLAKAAQAELLAGQRLNPQPPLETLRERIPYKNPTQVAHLLSTLYKAGLK